MPSVQRGQVFKLDGGAWAYRYRDEHGQRRQVGGFKGKGAASAALSPATILDWHEAGRIPSFKLPTGPVRFRASEVEAWLEGCRRGPCVAPRAGIESRTA